MGITSNDLKQCYSLAKQAREIQRVKEFIMLSSEKTTATLTKTPVSISGTSDKVGEGAAMIADLASMYESKIEKLLNHVWWVEQAIDELGESEYSRVLRMRYVEGMLWRDIAEELPCGERTVYRYHERALALLGIDPEEVKNIVISES